MTYQEYLTQVDLALAQFKAALEPTYQAHQEAIERAAKLWHARLTALDEEMDWLRA